jgi:polyisoprenoid-binding protein YceI
MTNGRFRHRTNPRRRGFGAAWPLLLLLCVGAAGFAGHAQADGTYALDQRFGSIQFSVDNVGLFTSEGQFKRFQSSLTIDEAHPERTRISVDVEAGSVDMPWEDGTAMLRSPEYFDVLHFPDVRFKSSAVEAVGPDYYVIRGALEIRRITQPCVLEARMIARHMDAARRIEVADFVVTGVLKRSDFGMVADQNFVSDTVRLKITAHLQLTPSGRAN